ncbi:MAG: DNA repair protein RadC [Alteromonadaceae bacterium]|nr:DNA repair protein RadC [Alteromonadaceae bacterium]
MAILREIEVRYKFTQVDCDITGKLLDAPHKVYSAFNFLKFEPKEKFVVINLSNQHTIMNYEVVASGTVNSVSLRPSEVLRTAVIINAPAVILAHNHPSGVPTPSQSDIQFTKRMQKVAELLDIKVLDHIIIGEDGFVSLNEKGLM